MTLVKRRRQFLQSARNIQGGNVCKIISLVAFTLAGVFYLMPRKRINDGADRRRRKSGFFNLDVIRTVIIRHSNTPEGDSRTYFVEGIGRAVQKGEVE